MKDIVIDVTRLADRALQGRLPTGVDRVGLAYVERFADRARALVRFGGRWLVLGDGGTRAVFDGIARPDPRRLHALRRAVAAAYVLPRPHGRPRLLFNVVHSGLDLPAYVKRVRREGWAPVFFLHDLIPITHPEYCRAGEAERHRRRLAAMLGVGEGIIVNSAATQNALGAYAAGEGRAVPPTVVAPLAPAPLPPPDPSRPIVAPYFLMLGTIEPRKNHLLLLHIWRRLVEERGAAVPRLVIVGHRGWDCEQVVDLLERCAALRGTVIELSSCSDGLLATYLHHAQALLFPSFEEGYGIPVVEALAAGIPVIASTLPVFREIAGAIPDYLDPLDGVAWTRAVLDYAAADSERRAAQMARMKGYRPPTWDDHFRGVDDFLVKIDAVRGRA